MARKIALVLTLALLLTCGPTGVTTAPSASPTATLTPIASSDLITLREGGQQSSLAVRKVATSELVTSLPDGQLLPDGKTLLAVEAGASQTKVTKLTRSNGAVIASMEIPGTWQLYRGFPGFTGTSADASHVALFGSSYNFTDASGTWTAKTTFGILDLQTRHLEPIELSGRYSFNALSNDGRFVYLVDFTTQPSRLRVYDVATRALGDVSGDPLPSADTFAMKIVGPYAFALVSSTETVQVRPDVVQVTPVAKLVRFDLAGRSVRMVRLPIDRPLTGEEPLMWSFVASRDAKTLYIVNPAAALAAEIDVASLELRRTTPFNDAKSLFDTVLAAIHPVAYGKMGFTTGAVLSPDGGTLYVLGATGVWSIDLGAFKARLLTRDGAYESIAVSPDGKRLYVLGREDGVVSAIDVQNGKPVGSMKRIAFPSDIVAVDAG